MPEQENDVPVAVNETPYVSQREGDIIKSKRKFGVEFEVNLDRNGQQALREQIAGDFRLEHDGSVNNGIEVVSPVLGGKNGEEQIVATCNSLNKVGAGADDSCGMHVHLSADDFFNMEETPVVSLSRALEIAAADKTGKFSFTILHSTVVKELKGHVELYQSIFARSVLDIFSLSAWKEFSNGLNQYNVLFTNGLGFEHRPRFTLAGMVGSRGVRIPFKDMEEIPDYRKYEGEPVLYASNNYSTVALVNQAYSAGDVVLVYNRSNDKILKDRLARLKRLAVFFVAFDDVIASMLPFDRRDNDFTKRIDTRISITDIARCDTILDFFNVWTKTKTIEAFRESMRNGRHESRYYGINFRSLLKHGTIEIRYHAGTTSAEKTLYWVALFQAVLDLAADLTNPRFSVERLEKASMIVDPDAKINLFFKKLGLPDDTERYLMNRIVEFKTQDDVFVEALLADDNPMKV